MRQSVWNCKFALVLCVFLAFGTGRGSAAQQPTNTVDPITLPSGTTISVRIADEVNSSHNHPGDLITGIVDPSVFIGDHVVIARGTEAHMRVMEDKKGGHLHGKALISLELISLVISKEKLDVDSDDFQKKQGALSAKAKGAGKASATSGTRAATSAIPEGGAVGPIIAVFRAAKVQLTAGTRIPFALTTPFTFDMAGGQTEPEGSAEPSVHP